MSESPDVIYKCIYYAWNVIKADPDENKFFDAAVAGEAVFLVTNDNHFNEAKKMTFHAINIISSDDFLQILSNLGEH